MFNDKMVEIEKIKFKGESQIDSKVVEELAKSIEKIGLLYPIHLTPDLELIAGRHRIEAYKLMGKTEIPAARLWVDELMQSLATIDENLIRKRLSPLEEATQLAERKKIYETLFPETRRGHAGAFAKHVGATDKISFAKDAANKTGQSERNINRKIKIFELLDPEVRELIKDTPIASNLAEVERLCGHPAHDQLEFIRMIRSGEAKDVNSAVKLRNASTSFANTDFGKFKKAVKQIDTALARLEAERVIECLAAPAGGLNREYSAKNCREDIRTLSKLKERLQRAIDILEDGIRNAGDPEDHDPEGELALPE